MPDIRPTLADLLAQDTAQKEASNPRLANAYQKLVERLLSGNAGRTAPRTGDHLPPFQLPSDEGQLVSSDDLLAEGPLVVSMNRGNWCSYCRTELTKLQEYLEAVEALGARIVAISPEIRHPKSLKHRCGLTFPLLCDVDNAYAFSLGLAIWMGEELKTIFREAGFDLPVLHRNQAWMIPVPATYVVDQQGLIVESFVDADFRKRMEPSDMIAALRALQARSSAGS